MEITQIKMYEILKSKLGEKETEAFVFLIEEKMDTKIDQRKHELATKADIASLRTEFVTLRTEFGSLRTDFVNLKDDFAALRQEFAELRLSTKEDMIKLKEEIMRTILLTSLGQLVTIVACVISLVLVFVKK